MTMANKLILKVELTPDNKINFENFTKHVPTLSYINALVTAEMVEQITQQKLKAEMKDAPRIHIQSGNELKGFLRRFKKKR